MAPLRTFDFTKFLLGIHNARGPLKLAFQTAVDADFLMHDDQERSERIYRAYGLSVDDGPPADEEAEHAWLHALDEAAYADAETTREMFSNALILHIDRLFRDLGRAAFDKEAWRVRGFGELFGGEPAVGGGYVPGTAIPFTRVIWALANSVRHFDEWFDLEQVPRIPSGPLTNPNIASAILGTHVSDEYLQKLKGEERQRVRLLLLPLTSMWTIERAIHRNAWEQIWTWEGLQEIATPPGNRPGEDPPRFDVIEDRLRAALKEIAASIGPKASSQLGEAERFMHELCDAQRRPK